MRLAAQKALLCGFIYLCCCTAASALDRAALLSCIAENEIELVSQVCVIPNLECPVGEQEACLNELEADWAKIYKDLRALRVGVLRALGALRMAKSCKESLKERSFCLNISLGGPVDYSTDLRRHEKNIAKRCAAEAGDPGSVAFRICRLRSVASIVALNAQRYVRDLEQIQGYTAELYQ